MDGPPVQESGSVLIIRTSISDGKEGMQAMEKL
jgi:hypothetical protein